MRLTDSNQEMLVLVHTGYSNYRIAILRISWIRDMVLK